MVEIDERYLVPGRSKAASNGLHKQWLTRLEYMSRSPYEVPTYIKIGRRAGLVYFFLGVSCTISRR